MGVWGDGLGALGVGGRGERRCRGCGVRVWGRGHLTPQLVDCILSFPPDLSANKGTGAPSRRHWRQPAALFGPPSLPLHFFYPTIVPPFPCLFLPPH